MYVIGLGFIKAPVKVGDQVELEIVGMGKSGDGLGYVEGFRVFVPGAKKGERVAVRLESVKPGYATGKLAEMS